MKKLVALYLFLVLMLCQFWFGSTVWAVMKPYLCGSVVLGATDKIGQRVNLTDLATWPEWTNSNIIGFRTRTFWNVVQPTSSTFDWSYLDAVKNLCLQHNKKWELSIVAGDGTPDWVYTIHGGTAAQVTTHDSNGAEVLMPVPWDIGYQTPWFAFMNAVAARYESDPRLLIIMQGGFMSGNSGMYFCTEADTTSSGMTASFSLASPVVFTFDAAYTQGAQQVITQSMAAFPTTQQSVTFVNPVPGHAVNLGSALKDWWTSPTRSWYPRMGFFVSSVFAATSPYASPNKTLYNHGFQCWHPIAGYTPQQDLYDGNPTPNPLPPYPGSLVDTVLNAVQKGGQYIEFYRPDTTAIPAQNVFALVANPQLCDNTPLSPTPTPTFTPTPTPTPTATPTATPTPTPTSTPAAIGRRQASCIDAVSITISPTHQRSVLIVQAYNGLNTTIPTLPIGWTNLNSVSGAGTAARWGWRASGQGETDCGIWTNATQVCCHEYANTNTVAGPLNFHKASSIGGVLSYTGFTLTHTDGTSWIVGFGGDSAATSGMDQDTVGGSLNNVANVLTANGLDTASGVTAYTTDTLTVVGGGSWVTGTMELARATATSTPTATSTATATFTPTPTATFTPTPTATATFTPTPTPVISPTFTATPTASPTFTPTATATATATSTPTVTATATFTPSPTATATPAPTCFLVAPTNLTFTDAQCHLGVLTWKNNDLTTAGFLIEGSNRPDRFRTIAVTNATPRYVLFQAGNTRYYRVRGFKFFFSLADIICYSGYSNILELREQDMCPPTPTPTATATP